MPGPASRRSDMSLWILSDVAPNSPPVAGYGGVALLVIVLVLAGALIVGFVLLLKRIKGRRVNSAGAAASSRDYSPE